MTHRHSRIVATLALALGIVGCQTDGPLASEDLIAAAPSLTPEGMLEVLELEPGQHAGVKMEEAHEAMGVLHGVHDDLMASLTEDRQDHLVRHVHDRLERHRAEIDHAEMERHEVEGGGH